MAYALLARTATRTLATARFVVPVENFYALTRPFPVVPPGAASAVIITASVPLTDDELILKNLVTLTLLLLSQKRRPETLHRVPEFADSFPLRAFTTPLLVTRAICYHL